MQKLCGSNSQPFLATITIRRHLPGSAVSRADELWLQRFRAAHLKRYVWQRQVQGRSFQFSCLDAMLHSLMIVPCSNFLQGADCSQHCLLHAITIRASSCEKRLGQSASPGKSIASQGVALRYFGSLKSASFGVPAPNLSLRCFSGSMKYDCRDLQQRSSSFIFGIQAIISKAQEH